MELKFGVMKWRNVMSFGQVWQEIDLSKPGTYHIVGENLDEGGSSGSGKTTIMSVLTWLFYDKVFSGISKDRLINNVNDAKNVMMEGECQLWAGADEYLVKKSRGAKNTVQLFKNGKDETPASVAAFSAKLEEIIGYSFELFSQLVIFNGSACPFLDLPARNQRELIEELFKITLLSRKAERLKEMAKETDAQLKLTTALYEQTKTKYLADLAKYEKDLTETHAKFEQWLVAEQGRLTQASADAIAALTKLKAQADSWADQEQLRLAEVLVNAEEQARAFDQQEQSGYAERLKNAELHVSVFNAKLSRIRDDLKATSEATPEKIANLAKLDADHKAITAELKTAGLEETNSSAAVARVMKELNALDTQLEHLADNNCPFCKQTFADAKTKTAELKAQVVAKAADAADLESKAGDARARKLELTTELNGLPPYDAAEHRRLVALSNSRADLEAELGRVTADQVQKKTELEYLKANPDSKRPNPWSDKVKAAELALSSFNPANNPLMGQVAVAEQKVLDTQSAQVDDGKNPYSTQLEYLAVNEPTIPNKEVEKELNHLSKMKEHQSVLIKLLTDKNSFIRKAIISKTLPFLNKRIAYYTERLGLPHIVTFQPDLTVEITKMGRPLDHGNLSGGEKQRLNFSLCLSFRDAMTYLHSRITLLVTDEIDGGKLDEQAVNNVIALIKHKAWDDKLVIFNISHRPEFEGRCDRTVVVRKEGGFSRIIKQVDS